MTISNSSEKSIVNNINTNKSAAQIRDIPSRNNYSIGLVGKKSTGISILPYDEETQTNLKNKKDEKVKKTETDKVEVVFYKYSEGISLAESVLINNVPMILQIENGISILNKKIELEYEILSPHTKSSHLSKAYHFSSQDEIEEYVKRAEKENLDSLLKKVENVWRKYFDIDDDTLSLCAADTIFTYFQDKIGMTHYLLFVGDNNTGKSNALRIFHQLAYRPIFDTSITTANVYNFLGMYEEAQGTILEDELDNIDNQPEKMKIYKAGYVSDAKVTRLYDSTGRNSKVQNSYNTFCFKAFSSERQPSFKAKGFSDRIFTINCSPGNPQEDISEVINNAGDPKHQKLFREIVDLRNLLLIYRMIHYNDALPDVDLTIKNRDKQLCKPLIKLFNNTVSIKKILASLSKFLAEKNNKKLNSFDACLFSTVSRLVEEIGTKISNDDIWTRICQLPGSSNFNKPLSYQTDDFGTISKKMITTICETKFGAQQKNDGEHGLVFQKDIIQKLKNNYSTSKSIEIIGKRNPNTFNTLYTFWNNVERKERNSNKINSNNLTKSDQDRNIHNENSDFNSEVYTTFIKDKEQSNDISSLQVLEPLEVLVSDENLQEQK